MNNKIFPPVPASPGVRANRGRRIFFGALSGFAAGTVASLVSGFINVLLFPDLPIHVDYSAVAVSLALWALLGGALACIAALSSQGWTSILLSAFLMAATILIINFVQGMNSLFLNLLVLLGLSLPFTAIMTPLAYIFYWLAQRFANGMSARGAVRAKMIVVNALVILAIGLAPGLYAKLGMREETAVRLIHETLNDGAQALSPDLYPKPLLKTEGFTEHKDREYTLGQSQSIYSTVGLDVTAHYADGYKIICTVVIYPGRDPLISPCKGRAP